MVRCSEAVAATATAGGCWRKVNMHVGSGVLAVVLICCARWQGISSSHSSSVPGSLLFWKDKQLRQQQQQLMQLAMQGAVAEPVMLQGISSSSSTRCAV